MNSDRFVTCQICCAWRWKAITRILRTRLSVDTVCSKKLSLYVHRDSVQTPSAAKQRYLNKQRQKHQFPSHSWPLHGPPKVICVKVSRKLGINVDDVHIALGRIPNDGLVVLPRCRVSFNIDAECAVELELQSVVHVSMRIVDGLDLLCCRESSHMVMRPTYMVASSLSAFSLSPPSTPSASRSCATPASLSLSCCNLSPSISRSLACFAILNFSVSKRRISAAWFVGLCWESVCSGGDGVRRRGLRPEAF